jgi:hypothetical protein
MIRIRPSTLIGLVLLTTSREGGRKTIATPKEPIPRSSTVQNDAGDVVPIVAPAGSHRDWLRRGEGLREARERIIKQISAMFPEFVDPYTLASFRGEPTAALVAVPAKYRALAPLIGQVYRLLEIERQAHPERFRSSNNR